MEPFLRRGLADSELINQSSESTCYMLCDRRGDIVHDGASLLLVIVHGRAAAAACEEIR